MSGGAPTDPRPSTAAAVITVAAAAAVVAAVVAVAVLFTNVAGSAHIHRLSWHTHNRHLQLRWAAAHLRVPVCRVLNTQSVG